MFSMAARRRTHIVLLAITLALTLLPIVACSKKPTAPSSSCPTDVYWDSGVSRCRDHSNGQFVKSACCGH